MSSSTQSSRGSGYRTRALLFAGGVFLGVLGGELARLPRAHAQIPDPALQRRRAHLETRQTNQLLKEIVNVLRTETLKVCIVEPDKPSRPRASKAGPKR